MRLARMLAASLVVSALLLASGCTRAKPEPTVPPSVAQPSDTVGPSTSSTVAIPTAVQPKVSPTGDTVAVGLCELIADGNIKVYRLPSLEGERFATLLPGERVVVQAATGDGWIGFDPGDAHAGDVGVLRLRWVRDGAALHLAGTCTDLPIVEGPPAGICLAAAMQNAHVHAVPDASSEVLLSLNQGEYAQALGWANDWLFLDLAVGSARLEQHGWIQSADVGFSGPCEELPKVTP